MPALCSADKTSYYDKKNDYVSKKFKSLKNYILNTKTKFSAACHNFLFAEKVERLRRLWLHATTFFNLLWHAAENLVFYFNI